ncbi:TetR/AcrR family transcriptional regulator [Pseudomonas sp. GD04087]|uniref:TetR/AcrR family transcriptional regulator n=1 Tax=unclassified Pseudomonas TaxID=196821 RepID=UPI002447E20C|nr:MULTISPECIES: helix-turn-helix domain containing protein [unclassified Pseudomonas]MDH0291378.1 TetR/AcrR family transcriptional regulator [Pseudomonas sp. GD04087]MDH1049461.1 TetR/AcrR family transcriptional regulator [Pseudomonas sp. GD03903]MDH2000045.1 TetR/AcrR family transcriptional regulator [Pseudomonas sp. GD03691]
MARTKTVSNEAILDAAMALMVRAGPEAVTFAAVGREVGLSAATLVQRYASKAEFLRAVLLRAWDRLDEQTACLDDSAELSPEGAVRMLLALFPVGEGESDYAEGLLILREDMRDPLLRERGACWGAALAAALGRRLSDDPQRQPVLGRLMASQWQGAQLWWAFERQGDPATAIGGELRRWCDVVLKAERVAV